MGADESCERFDRVEVAENDEAIELTAIVEVREGASCMDMARFLPVEVTLDAPLGDRQLRGCMAGEGSGRPDILVRTSCNEITEEGV